jgi:hypothetical protein
MMRVLSKPPPSVSGPLENVFRQATESGAPPPTWVAVEDDERRWILEVAATAPCERARGVVAVRTEAALRAAIRLGIGGAFRLPPSTVAARDAFEAAAAVAEPTLPDPGLADLAAVGHRDLVLVSWNCRSFWRCQLGETEMAACLAELASELQVPPAMVSWPALLVGGRSESAIRDAWDRVVSRRRLVSDGLVVERCPPAEDRWGVTAAATRCLAALEEGPWDEDTMAAVPVYELPSGARVGTWSRTNGRIASEGGWHAVPVGETPTGLQWRLTGDGPDRVIDEVLEGVQIQREAVRVPGWVGVAVGRGRPAGLLVEVLAAAAARQGAPLWVPNIGQQALDMLLRLPGTFWVDGPAAPSADEADAVQPRP